MKIAFTTAFLLLLFSTVTSRSIPRSDLALRDVSAMAEAPEFPDLEKRRGGGGGGGRGGGGSSSSSGGRSGGRSGSSGSSGSSSSRTGSSSNVGGATRSGSGTRPVYGGGTYYAGGAKTPYRAGTRSPLGIAPFFLPVAALAFFPGIWLYGAYAYPYNNAYHYRNETSNQNETIPVVCLCDRYSECGCDDNNNSTYYESLFNGSEPMNSSVVKVVNVNGTEKIYINGTLPNGTTAADSSVSSAPATTILHASGYWTMVALVVSAVWAL